MRHYLLPATMSSVVGSGATRVYICASHFLLPATMSSVTVSASARKLNLHTHMYIWFEPMLILVILWSGKLSYYKP